MSELFRVLHRGEHAGDSKQCAGELEAACNVRVRAWRYIFDCYAKKKAERKSQPSDVDREINLGPEWSFRPHEEGDTHE